MTIIHCNIHHRADVDSCRLCDEDNPRLARVARLELVLDRRTLTEDGEYAEGDGWTYLTDEIKKFVARFPERGVYLGFVEWEGPAEVS